MNHLHASNIDPSRRDSAAAMGFGANSNHSLQNQAGAKVPYPRVHERNEAKDIRSSNTKAPARHGRVCRWGLNE